jgi:hypothetical protein
MSALTNYALRYCAITATDDNGNMWYAVNDHFSGEWCAITHETFITRAKRILTTPASHWRLPSELGIYDRYGHDLAVMHCATVSKALPMLQWSVRGFNW